MPQAFLRHGLSLSVILFSIDMITLAAGEVAYYDDLTYETLENVFYPEEDFFLDENGDPVFFLQEAMVAPQTEGILYFPFTLEELLDEI